MNSYVTSFLRAVLGDEASAALEKAGERSGPLSSVIGARVVLGWLGVASRYGYEGEIPGIPGSYLELAKTEGGVDGEVRLGKSAHSFEGADVPLVASAVCVSLGADVPPDADLRDGELAKLGKNIDLLIMARVASLAKAEGESGDDGECDCPDCEVSGCGCPCHGDLDKAGGFTAPGKEAPQNPPSGPQGGGFTPPTPTTPRRQQKGGGFRMKLTQSEAAVRCSVCGGKQMSGDVFKGCACLRDLAKSVDVRGVEGGYQLTLRPPWTKQDAALLMDIVTESEASDG